jgi:hypothetical protein
MPRRRWYNGQWVRNYRRVIRLKAIMKLPKKIMAVVGDLRYVVGRGRCVGDRVSTGMV